MENEFQSGENNSLKKHIGLIALLLVLLIIGMVFTSYYTTFLTQTDSPEQVEVVTKEEEVAADITNYTDAIWLNNDTELAQNILEEVVQKFEADHAYAVASVKLGYTEADHTLTLAKILLTGNPEAGLDLFAHIYFDESHTVTERADALFYAMQYVAKALPSDAPLATTKVEIFGEDRFGLVLNSIEYSYDDITTPYQLRLAALEGMREAADMTGSYRIRGFMLSEEYRLKAEAELENIHEAITGAVGQAATQSEVQAYLADNPAVAEKFDKILADTRRHHSRYMMSLVNNTELFVYYNPEIIYGINNVLWTYGTLGYLGYDVLTDLTEAYETGKAHLERYASDEMTIRWSRDYDIQTGVLGLTTACAHVQQDLNLEEEKIAEYLDPVVSLAPVGKKILATDNNTYEVTNSCHGPLLYLGTLYQPLQDTLVNDMDGWTSEQFTLTQ